MKIPKGYIKKLSSTIPFGYELDKDYTGYLKPIPDQIEALELVSQMISDEEISLGIGVDYLEARTDRIMSREGLRLHVNKVYGREERQLSTG